MSKEIFFSDEARNGLYGGVKKLADAVKVTMGPRGRNVLIQKEHSAPHITKDGVSVAKEIELSDPLENMGAQVVKEVSANTAEEAGDGTTTATVLAHAIFKEGLRNITAGANPVEVKRGMDKAVTAVIENLKAASRPVTDKSEIAQVATISANSDFAIGNLIADAMERVGNDGVITVEEAKGMQDELEVVEGMQFDRGYLSPYFINNQEKNNVEMANPFVLITDKKITSLKDILPVLESTQKAGKPLVIIAEDVEGEALSSLVVNKLQGVLNVAAVKAPGFGNNRVETLKDIAVLTGGTLIASDLNMDLTKVTMDMLGTCGRIVIDKEDTTIVEGHGDPESVTARVAELKSQSDAAVSAHDKETLSKRISKLSGGVAVIKVGAASETEMKEKKDRVDDALAATKAAVEEGIVIGGGAALIKASAIDVELEGDQAIGVTIIKHAVTAPIKQISENAGYDSGVVVRDVFNDKPDYGFNAATGEHVDMFEAGIIDPLKVVRVALQNAVSVSSLLLTTEATVTIEKDDNQSPMMGQPPMY